MALPCVIKSERLFFDIPLVAKARKFNETAYFLDVEPNENIEACLKRIYGHDGPYDMDCSLYAQMASIVFSEAWPSGGGVINLFLGTDFGGFMLWRTKIAEMGYITVASPKIAKHLSEMATTSKGQWCIRVSDNQYLGLASDGPKLLSLQEWVERLRTSLEEYSKDVDHRPHFLRFGQMPDIQHIRRILLDLYFKTGEMDKWAFFSQQNYEHIYAQYTPEGITLSANPEQPPEDDPETKLVHPLNTSQREDGARKCHSIFDDNSRDGVSILARLLIKTLILSEFLGKDEDNSLGDRDSFMIKRSPFMSDMLPSRNLFGILPLRGKSLFGARSLFRESEEPRLTFNPILLADRSPMNEDFNGDEIAVHWPALTVSLPRQIKPTEGQLIQRHKQMRCEQKERRKQLRQQNRKLSSQNKILIKLVRHINQPQHNRF